jgi:hypothetical protein
MLLVDDDGQDATRTATPVAAPAPAGLWARTAAGLECARPVTIGAMEAEQILGVWWPHAVVPVALIHTLVPDLQP